MSQDGQAWPQMVILGGGLLVSVQAPWQSASVGVKVTHEPLWHHVPPSGAPQQCPSWLGSGTHTPLSHVLHSAQLWQAPAPVPQAASSSMWQMLSAQQPVEQRMLSQTQSPLTQRWPVSHDIVGPL
jgi:hypothetical protein